ncbi:hypothetical protein BSKO_06508 [Bryopsis sp. KO-2023]|nr:hypothetical protein BSKO_06508 [Bryopsis sp. KO-2023]
MINTAFPLLLMEDQVFGRALLFLSSIIFAYYTAWLLFTPFVEDHHFLLHLFPERRYAYLLPVFAGATLFCVTVGHIGYVLLAAGLTKPPEIAKKTQ